MQALLYQLLRQAQLPVLAIQRSTYTGGGWQGCDMWGHLHAGADVLLRLLADLLPSGQHTQRTFLARCRRSLWALLPDTLACSNAFAHPVTLARA